MASQDYRQIPVGEDFEDLDLEFSPIDNNPNEKDWFLRRRSPSFNYTALARSPLLRYGLGFVVLILMSTAFVLGVGLGTLHRRLQELESGLSAAQNNVSYSPTYRPLLQSGQTIVNFNLEVADYEAARSECRRIAHGWRGDLFISCNITEGDVIAMRSSVLACARYAVQAEVGFAIPRLGEEFRNSSLSDVFNEDHFIANLQDICPGLPIIRNISDIKDISRAEKISFPSSGKMVTVEKFKEEVDRYVNTKAAATPETPGIMQLKITPYEWKYFSDNNAFSTAFGGLLEPREDIQILASKILYQLQQELPLGISLSSSLLQNGTFAAAHLDRYRENYEGHTKIYLDTLADLAERGANYSYLYVSSANSSAIDKLRIEASKIDITVLTKWDLLKEVADIEYMEKNLTEEHHMLVDYLVMLKSGWFMGSGKSSCSIEMAAKRHRNGKGKGNMTWPRDEWSYIIGEIDESIVERTWV
ncbi:hypothetical protein AA313_de0200453 [Arthrobotrys entomopaga]|nr:hypothetical protein AA313_de0200453 [Arthrobotrys entomopaga]